MWWAAFSTTTIASSTTMPIASTRPNSVSMFTREAQQRHREERADDRDGHGRRGHQHGPPVLQEDQDHEQHEHAGFDQRFVDRFDRCVDELRRVERELVVHALGKRAAHLVDRRADVLGDLDRVAARQLVDADVGGRDALLEVELVVGLGAELDAWRRR